MNTTTKSHEPWFCEFKRSRRQRTGKRTPWSFNDPQERVFRSFPALSGANSKDLQAWLAKHGITGPPPSQEPQMK
eukprot:5030140-Amphidinium_carterae.1